MSLYEVVLGERWREMSPAVRDVHSPGKATGRLEVRRGGNVLARWIGAVLGFPRACAEAALQLTVEARGGEQEWVRLIGSSTLRTTQHARGAALVERMGRFECVFELEVDDGALVFMQREARLVFGPLRIPVPGLRIEGRAEESSERVQIDVRLHAPFVGLVLRYTGTVTAEAAS